MQLSDAIVYHLYPLGALGVIDGPRPCARPSPLSSLVDWIPVMQRVGANTALIGPVFESQYHGYDTVDLTRVDARLGTNEDLARLSRQLSDAGIALVLDAVFNHVGRSHPLVQEVAREGPSSQRARWIAGFDPSRRRGGLPFHYEGWAGHDDLVKLDTAHPEVREWLYAAALRWVDAFGLAGLRIDAADCIDRAFLRTLRKRCREVVPDFFLIGEAVRGEHYRPLLTKVRLDAVTNFEASKGLWSSFNDHNLHEIAWTLQRLFGEGGLAQGHLLYSFADNHDVDRVASQLRDPSAHLAPLYGLLFAMPGVPSIYYGSEVGWRGRRRRHSDAPLRPALAPDDLAERAPEPGLAEAIARFSEARRRSRAVREGDYLQLAVASETLAFQRRIDDELTVAALNISDEEQTLELRIPDASGCELRDLLDGDYSVAPTRPDTYAVRVPPRWLRWLARG